MFQCCFVYFSISFKFRVDKRNNLGAAGWRRSGASECDARVDVNNWINLNSQFMTEQKRVWLNTEKKSLEVYWIIIKLALAISSYSRQGLFKSDGTVDLMNGQHHHHWPHSQSIKKRSKITEPWRMKECMIALRN